MLEAKDFFKSFYEKNKELYSCIVSPEFIVHKANRNFFSGRWGSTMYIKSDIIKSKDYLIFGLKSGIYFIDVYYNKHNIIVICDSPGGISPFGITLDLKYKNINDFLENNNIEITDKSFNYYFTRDKVFIDRDRRDRAAKPHSHGQKPLYSLKLEREESKLLIEIIKNWYNEIHAYEEDSLKLRLRTEEERVRKLNDSIISVVTELDRDGDGQVDLIDGESFNKLLSKNQKSIIEIDKQYIQKFVKISIYLNTKKSNTQRIFESINKTNDEKELTELVSLLKNQVHTYELLVFHSISMITSLVENNLIAFYEIYECFDKLGMFNSNWENEVSDKLTNIGYGIKQLMYSIYRLESNIINSIDKLTYITQDSFSELNSSVNKQLSSIDSSIKFNNLLSSIQTYQMYKLNKNTK